MTDLTKITTPFALLDDETREALKAHGGPYEYWGFSAAEWLISKRPRWATGIIYRVAPGTKDSINWDHVSGKFICMARDANGWAYVYTAKPKTAHYSVIWICDGDDAFPAIVDAVASYKRGTCDWKDSLVFRPGHEPKGEQNDE